MGSEAQTHPVAAATASGRNVCAAYPAVVAYPADLSNDPAGATACDAYGDGFATDYDGLPVIDDLLICTKTLFLPEALKPASSGGGARWVP